MAIFTGIGAAIAAASTFFASIGTVGTFLLTTAASIGLNLAAKALAGKPQAAQQDGFSVQGKLQASGDVPRSFQLGYLSTAGSLVYANAWGQVGETPNAFFTQVIALQDLPGGDLVEVWVNGELCTLDTSPDVELGYGVEQYFKDGTNHLWVKFYDGTQTTADSWLVNKVDSAERPYEATRVGTGIAYVVVTSLVDDTLFSGFPTFKFALSGIPLYDVSKDSTAGGSGSHRWNDKATWGGDGDNLPAVQLYNVLRGVSYNGQWLYGLQRMTGARLPAANWIAQIAKCRATIEGEDGPEPTYRSGGQVNVDAQIANLVEALLTSCQGRLSEIGGFYKLHLGAPDSPTFSFTDDDILSTDEQTYRPFFALADTINGIAAKYPLPAEGWNTKVAPPIYRSDLEAKDGGRRLLANPSFDFVPYSAQAQRLMSSALEEAQRARTHTLSLPPSYWPVEPGDIGAWTSARNGYDGKLFRVDAVVDRANLDIGASLTEVDPSDYDWDHEVDFEPVPTGPTLVVRPAPQGVVDWYAEPASLTDEFGVTRRAAIRIAWDGTLPGIRGVTYQVRRDGETEIVASGSTDQYSVGALIISQSIIPDTAYEVRGQYLPSSPREMLWSAWLDVTTPSVEEFELGAAITYQVTEVMDYLDEEIAKAVQLIASVTSNKIARTWLDKQEVRKEIVSRTGKAFARISRVEEVSTAANAAMATAIDVLEAELDGVAANVTTTSTALAALDLSFGSFSTSVTASLGSLTSSVATNSTAISSLNSSFGSFSTSVTASLGSLTASVSTNTAAIATLDGYAAAKYSVRLDVNGYATGFDLINAGAGVSAFNVVADKFQVAQPGVTGGSLIPVFTIANVNGAPKLALRGDMLVDGDILARHLSAGSVTTVKLDAQSVTAAKMAANSITAASGAIEDLSIKTLKLEGNAVTIVRAVEDTGLHPNTTEPTGTYCEFSIVIDTTGLIGEEMNFLVSAFWIHTMFSGGNYSKVIQRQLDGGAWTNLFSMSDGVNGTFRENIQTTTKFTVTATSHTIGFRIGSALYNSTIIHMLLTATACKR